VNPVSEQKFIKLFKRGFKLRCRRKICTQINEIYSLFVALKTEINRIVGSRIIYQIFNIIYFEIIAKRVTNIE
jgi:hypothetical protein